MAQAGDKVDALIKQKLDLVNEKIAELKEIKRPKVTTNLVINFNGNSHNLNVLNVERLAELAYEISLVDEKKRTGYELIGLPMENETEIGDFPISVWLEDIKVVAQFKGVQEKLVKLRKTEKELNKHFSEATKRENVVNDLLNGLDI